MTESQLQKTVARLLDSTGLLWEHVANEANWMGLVRRALIAALGSGRGVFVAARIGALIGKWNKENGVKAGSPDIKIFTPFPDPGDDESDRHLNEIRGNWLNGLAIELKVGKNKPTPAQLKWHEDLRDCGWRVEVCRSVDEVLTVLRECYPNKFKP